MHVATVEILHIVDHLDSICHLNDIDNDMYCNYARCDSRPGIEAINGYLVSLISKVPYDVHYDDEE